MNHVEKEIKKSLKKRLRYRIVCWLLHRLHLEESAFLYFEWERSHHKIHKDLITTAVNNNGVSPFRCPHCYKALSETDIYSP